MFNVKDIIGWIGNAAVFKTEGGYTLVDWPCGWKQLTIIDRS